METRPTRLQETPDVRSPARRSPFDASHAAPRTAATPLQLRQVAGRIGAEIAGVRLSGRSTTRRSTRSRPRCCATRCCSSVASSISTTPRRKRSHAASARPSRTRPCRPSTAAQPCSNSIPRTARAPIHTDVTFVDAYPKISILRAVVIPPFGGDTVGQHGRRVHEPARPARARRHAVGAAHQRIRLRVDARMPTIRNWRYREVFTSTVYETEHRSCASTRKPANARSCSGISCSGSRAVGAGFRAPAAGVP